LLNHQQDRQSGHDLLIGWFSSLAIMSSCGAITIQRPNGNSKKGM